MVVNREPLISHLPALRRYARALTGDAWAADDLVQDTLERACTKWQLLTAGSDLRAWLFTVMHNLFANQMRSNSRRGQGRLVDIDEVAPEQLVSEGDVGNTLDIQRCLLRLPEEQRVTLLLVTLEDMSYADVAKIMGVPIGTVMSRLSRARSRLQELLDMPVNQVPVGQSPSAPSPKVVQPTLPTLPTSPTAVTPLRRLK